MKLVCYGDSNTYGYDGDEIFGGRFPEGQRWPELLGQMLGCEVINCGLNGRRVPRFQRTIDADLALLRRCGDGGLILVMLGTNDILCEAEPEDTAAHMDRFLTLLAEALPDSALLLCAPPPVTVDGGSFVPGFEALAAAYEELAEERGILFVDTAPWQIPTGRDGIHFSARGHRSFALKMGQTLRFLLR
jgi:Lysophospholipase L1 and related esterases